MNFKRRSSPLTRRSTPSSNVGPQLQSLESRTLFNSVAVFQTTMGNFGVELFDGLKPQSVQNFINVASKGLYTGTIIHRSSSLGGDSSGVKQIIQGGGYESDKKLTAVKDPFPDVPDELNLNGLIHNTRGTFSYAKTGPNSANTQWFVNLTDNSSSLDSEQNNGGYTAFGQVTTDTLSAIDTIAALPTQNLSPGTPDALNPFTSVPVNGQNAVVVSNVSFSELDLTLGAGGAKSISFVDTDGTKSTLSLSGGGAASLHFVGTGMTRTVRGGSYVIGGKVSAIGDMSIIGSTGNSKLTLSGKKGNGTFTIGGIATNGPVKSLSIGGVSLGGPITIGGTVGSFSATGGLNANISATSIGKATVKGDVTGVTVTLSAGLGKTTVSGSIASSTFNVGTIITSVSAKSLSGAQIYAGLNLPGGGVPSSLADFANAQARIGSVTAKTTTNTNIAAFELGKLSLGTWTLNNGGTPFGLGAHTIGSLSINAVPGGKFSAKHITDSVTLQQALLARSINLTDARIILV